MSNEYLLIKLDKDWKKKTVVDRGVSDQNFVTEACGI